MASTKTFPPGQAVPERSSRKYRTQLVDLDGAPVQAGVVSSILMSLLDARTNTVVNGRDRVQVRNANGGTLSSLGVFSMVFTSDDMQTTDGTNLQPRKMILEVVYTDGVENHEVFFWVKNMPHLP